MGQWDNKEYNLKIKFLPHYNTGMVFNPITNESIIDTIVIFDCKPKNIRKEIVQVMEHKLIEVFKNKRYCDLFDEEDS